MSNVCNALGIFSSLGNAHREVGVNNELHFIHKVCETTCRKILTVSLFLAWWFQGIILWGQIEPPFLQDCVFWTWWIQIADMKDAYRLGSVGCNLFSDDSLPIASIWKYKHSSKNHWCVNNKCKTTVLYWSCTWKYCTKNTILYITVYCFFTWTWKKVNFLVIFVPMTRSRIR